MAGIGMMFSSQLTHQEDEGSDETPADTPPCVGLVANHHLYVIIQTSSTCNKHIMTSLCQHESANHHHLSLVRSPGPSAVLLCFINS